MPSRGHASRAPVSQPVVVAFSVAALGVNAMLAALPGVFPLSGAQAVLASGTVAVLTGLVTFAVERLRTRGGETASVAEPAAAAPEPFAGERAAGERPGGELTAGMLATGASAGLIYAGQRAFRRAVVTGVVFGLATIIGAYWLAVSLTSWAWQQMTGVEPVALGGRFDGWQPSGSGTERWLIVVVAVLFVLAHGLAASVLVASRDLLGRIGDRDQAPFGATIAAVGHLAAALLWASQVALLTIGTAMFAVAYSAVMIVVIIGRLMLLNTLTPLRRPRFVEGLVVIGFGLISPVFQLVEVLTWWGFGGMLRRRAAGADLPTA